MINRLIFFDYLRSCTLHRRGSQAGRRRPASGQGTSGPAGGQRRGPPWGRASRRQRRQSAA